MMSIDSACGLSRVISRFGVWLALLLAGWGASAAPAVSESYRIQATDILLIEVVNEPELKAKDFRVAQNGEIAYPYIGSVKSEGLTTLELQDRIKALLEADYLVSAQVLVQVREFRKQQVSVFGQVGRPGLIDIPPERKMTVLEAITAAGGLTRLARGSDIQLTRAGRTEPMRFTLSQLRDPEKVVYVQPGDMIFVPESRI